MRRGLKVLLPGLLVGLAVVQAGCQSEGRPWVAPEEHRVRLVSDAEFIRTSQGDYVDGYLAEYESEFQVHRMFISMELLPYAKEDRLLVSVRRTGDFVRMPSEGPGQGRVPVFEVEKAQPDVPGAPDISTIK